MTLDEIKQAIDEGKTVHWSNEGYVVIKDSIGQYLIAFDRHGRNPHYIGLTWEDGVTMNCNSPDEFFIAGPMTEYTVHFQRGTRVGARSLRMIRVEAANAKQAAAKARIEAKLDGLLADGYKLTRVDHFDEETDRLIID